MTSFASRGIAITTRGLVKRFDNRAVINQLDLYVPPGEFLAIVGRSGCGKSTLLRLLTGLDMPSDGTLSLGTDETQGTSKDAARIMFQEPRLLPWASVVDNVAIGLSGVNVAPAVAKERALAALRETGLEQKAGQWPSTLSGGQKQRVALARALVSQPRFIAFDEPLGALDALTRIEMQSLIERVYLEQGFTAILVTHDVREALSLADRVIMLDGGSVALDVRVPLPRPRPRASASLAELEDHILSRLVTPPDQQAA